MPAFELNRAGTVTPPGGEPTAFYMLDGFTRAYVEALFWLETEPGTTREDRADDLEEWTERAAGGQQKELPGDYGFGDLSPGLLDQIRTDCAAFQEAAKDLLALAYAVPGYDETRAGHDFWLTRNGHGAGFWDRDELSAVVPESDETLGDRLSALCGYGTDFPPVDVYMGDDGKAH